MDTGSRAIFAFSWAQTEVEGWSSPPLDMITAGATWSWRGEALRLFGPQGLLSLGPAKGMEELRTHAARAVRRWLRGPLLPAVAPDDTPVRQSFTVTDGRRAWLVSLAGFGTGRGAPVAVISGDLPPQGCELWVVDHDITPETAVEPKAMVGFTQGTQILCEDGWHPVEQITEGMRVQTVDAGCQPVLWHGMQRISGARLRVMPAFAPVRLRGDALQSAVPEGELLVAPDHRILLRGPRARALFGCDETLAAARDLVDDRLIRVARGLREVRYHHLLLPGHQIIMANGVETESFLPSLDAVRGLDPESRRRLPADAQDPANHPPARRILTRSEAAIVAQAA